MCAIVWNIGQAPEKPRNWTVTKAIKKGTKVKSRADGQPSSSSMGGGDGPVADEETEGTAEIGVKKRQLEDGELLELEQGEVRFNEGSEEEDLDPDELSLRRVALKIINK